MERGTVRETRKQSRGREPALKLCEITWLGDNSASVAVTASFRAQPCLVPALPDQVEGQTQ